MIRTDDPIADALEYDSEFEDWLKTRPVCSECGEHIQEETAIRLSAGWVCEDCISAGRHFVEEW